jgi:hypothetical protein
MTSLLHPAAILLSVMSLAHPGTYIYSDTYVFDDFEALQLAVYGLWFWRPPIGDETSGRPLSQYSGAVSSFSAWICPKTLVVSGVALQNLCAFRVVTCRAALPRAQETLHKVCIAL